MKILWLCNIELPQISVSLNRSACVFGGWLSQVSSQLLKEHELCVLYPSDIEINGTIENLIYYSFDPNDEKCENKVFNKIIRDFSPDVIHVWGTEFSYSNVFIHCVLDAGLIDCCAISIQGLVSVYASHYFEGLPDHIINRYTIRDLIKRDNIRSAKSKYDMRGRLEIDSIQCVKNIIGRTDWDRACTYQINPNARYFHCNETLRSVFYQGGWDIKNVNRHSIFVSQSSYPIKGLHNLLKVFPYILREYPDSHIYTTGRDLLHLSVKDKIKISSYQKYILELIQNYRLEDNITFLGTLDEEEMFGQYKTANVFVSTSSIENSPNSVGEAMLVGCPTVASYVGGTKNMLEDGIDGFLYQSTAPYMLAYYILQIFNNDELAIEFSHNAMNHSRKTHNAENNYKNLVEIYKTLNTIKKETK